jgi:hypothetical protein
MWRPKALRPKHSRQIPLGAGPGIPLWWGRDEKGAIGALGEPEAASLHLPLVRRRTIFVQPAPDFACEAYATPPLLQGRVFMRWRDVSGHDMDEESKSTDERTSKGKPKLTGETLDVSRKLTAEESGSLPSVAARHMYKCSGGILLPQLPENPLLWSRGWWQRLRRGGQVTSAALKRQLTGSIMLQRGSGADSVKVEGMHRHGAVASFAAKSGGAVSFDMRTASGSSGKVELSPGGPYSIRFASGGAAIQFKATKRKDKPSDRDVTVTGAHSDTEKSTGHGLRGSYNGSSEADYSSRHSVWDSVRRNLKRPGHTAIPGSGWVLSAIPTLQVPVPLGGTAEFALTPDGSHSARLTAPSGAYGSVSLSAVPSSRTSSPSSSPPRSVPSPASSTSLQPPALVVRPAPSLRFYVPTDLSGSSTSVSYAAGPKMSVSRTAVLFNGGLTVTGCVGTSETTLSAGVQGSWGCATLGGSRCEPPNASLAINARSGSASMAWKGANSGKRDETRSGHVLSVRLAHFY